jgi:uncharacterized membrane protein YoaT (DUF817 family)
MTTFLREFWLFGLKQARASVFGGLLLFFIIVTKLWYPIPGLARNDFLFLIAIAIQLLLLAFKLEEPREAIVILLFHAVATIMEIFKTDDRIRAWVYPGEAVIRIGNVPLFAGFMYSAVGSYIARIWRLFDMQYSSFPHPFSAGLLAVAIYVNFFTHHFFFDIRYFLLAWVAWSYGPIWVYFKIDKVHRRMPLLLGFTLVALFIWIAENISTFAKIWIYPSQLEGWSMVPISKLVSWLLLMVISFVLVAVVRRPRIYRNQVS